MVRIRPSLLATCGAGACLSLLVFLYLSRHEQDAGVSGLMERLPASGGVCLYVNTAALRESGLLEILAGAGAEEEPDYRQFVRRINFDYREDMDELLAFFSGGDAYFLVRGRFDWKRLYQFTNQRGGDCHNGYCWVGSVSPPKRISFFAVTPRLMALASSRDRNAASLLMQRSRSVPGDSLPDEPVWLMTPGALLAEAKWLPDGMRSFATALSPAEEVVVAIDQSGEAFEARLRARFPTPEEAETIARNLSGVTELLGSLIRREGKEPNPADLSGVLTSGVFEHNGPTVIGRWAISWNFLKALSGEPTG